MRTSTLLPIFSVVAFVAYSAITMATSGAASFAASPLLVLAVAMLVRHDRLTEAA